MRTSSARLRNVDPSSVFRRPAFARVRRLCLALPETSETSSWGHPNFKAGRKTFCAFEMIRGRPSVAFRLSPADVEDALRRESFFATPYGRGVWVSVWLDEKFDATTIRKLVDRSYAAVATKRLLRARDERRPT